MDIRARLKEIDDRISDSTGAYRVKKAFDAFLPIILILLVGALYFEFFATLSHRQHQLILWIERFIFGFFVCELLLDLGIYRNNRRYFEERWVDIVLVFPLLLAFQTIIYVVQAVMGLKALKFLKVKKGAKLGRTVKKAQPYQHATKAVKKLKELFD